MISLLALFVTQSISYTEAGKRLALFIPEFSKAIGRPLSVGKNIEDEVICLRVVNDSSDDILAKIALAFEATWVQVGGTLVLKRSKEQIQETNNRERQAAQSKFVYAQELLRDQLKSAIPLTPERADAFARLCNKGEEQWKGVELQVDRFDPLKRFLRQFYTNLPPSILNEVKRTKRIIWSNNPTRMQRSFPGVLNQRIPMLTKELNMMIAPLWRESHAENQRTSFGWRTRHSYFSFHDDEKVSSPLANITAVATFWGRSFQGFPELDLEIFDAKGKKVAGFLSLDPQEGKPALKPDSVEAKTIRGDDIYVEARSRFHDQRAIVAEPYTRFLKEYINRDPLSFLAGNILVEYSTKTRQNLVANLPDAAEALFLELDSPDSPAEFERSLPSYGLKRLQVGTWTILGPASASPQRADRLALARYMTMIQARHFLSIEECADANRQLGNDSLVHVVTKLDSPNEEGVDSLLYGSVGDFFVSLSEQQKHLMKQSMLIRDLTPAQQKMVTRLVYEERDLKPSSAVEGVSLPEMFDEPTRSLPEGVPLEATITLKETYEPRIQPLSIVKTTGRMDEDDSWGLDTFASFLLPEYDPPEASAYTFPTLGGSGGNTQRYDRARVKAAIRRTIEFHVQFTSGLCADAKVVEERKNAPFVSYLALPKNTRDEIERLKSLAEQKLIKEGWKRKVQPPQL